VFCTAIAISTLKNTLFSKLPRISKKRNNNQIFQQIKVFIEKDNIFHFHQNKQFFTSLNVSMVNLLQLQIPPCFGKRISFSVFHFLQKKTTWKKFFK